jgi:hypothetical protein
MQAGTEDKANTIIQEEARRLEGANIEKELVTGADEEDEGDEDEEEEADEGKDDRGEGKGEGNEEDEDEGEGEKTGKKD